MQIAASLVPVRRRTVTRLTGRCRFKAIKGNQPECAELSVLASCVIETRSGYTCARPHIAFPTMLASVPQASFLSTGERILLQSA